MNRNFTSVTYSQGGYAIGQLANDYITGLGYCYLVTEGRFSMGWFNNGKKSGWACDTQKDSGDVRICRWLNGSLVSKPGAVSFKNHICFYQDFANDEDEGLRFVIWEDGSWQYYFTENGDKKNIYYHAEEKKLWMGCLRDNEWVWSKELANGELDSDFALPYAQLVTENDTDPGEFEESYNMISSVGGPVIAANDDANPTTVISTYGGQDSDGLVFIDETDEVTIRQMNNGERNGPDVSFAKDGSRYSYFYWEDNERLPQFVNWTDDGTIEIRYYEDDNHSNIISIDGNLNVSYIRNYNSKTKKYDEMFEYNYDESESETDDNEADEVLEEVDDRDTDEEDEVDFVPKKKTAKKTTKKTTTKKKKTSSSDDDDDDLISTFLKKFK